MGTTQFSKPGYAGASKSAIQHHYDVGNAFYSLWLDPTLSYSCALWSDRSLTLEDAQNAKLDLLAEQASVRGAGHVIDVGCGWGALSERLVKVHGVENVTALTLSENQKSYLDSRVTSEIDVQLSNWHGFHPDRPCDAVISIEAFEAFARPGLSPAEKIAAYRDFFEHCSRWLRTGGHLVIQTIAFGSMKSGEVKEFIVDSIFPESDLPRLTEILLASEDLFEICQILNHREHYVKTLKAWATNLQRHRQQAIELVGEEAVERYRRYLLHSIIGFASGAQQLLRMTFRKRPERR